MKTRKKGKKRRFLIGIMGFTVGIVCLIIVQYSWHGEKISPGVIKKIEVVAHRGVHQNYLEGSYDYATGCEAAHMLHPRHDYIENTIGSIQAAFENGATIVEIDIRRTKDHDLVVFHDFGLECRTDGSGLVKDREVSYLKKLDIGYGYSADGGKTYPFRGKGVGLMPTLDEILSMFPDKKFLIDHKDFDELSTKILIKILKKYPEAQRKCLFLWTHSSYLQKMKYFFPEMKPLFLSRKEAKKYFLPFFLSFGWIKCPKEYQGYAIGFPANYVQYIWGWPHRFIRSIHKTGLKFFIIVNTKQEAKKMKNIPVDGFITDFIQITGPVLKQRK